MINHGFNNRFVQKCTVCNHCAHQVRIHVWGRTSVLNISKLLLSCHCWYSDWGWSITDSIWECFSTWGFVTSCQSLRIVSIQFDVLNMSGWEFLNDFVDILHLSFSSSHFFCGVICMASGSIPVFEEFWFETYWCIEIFSDSLNNISWHPNLISYVDTFARANLIFPLAWLDFAVCSRNI